MTKLLPRSTLNRTFSNKDCESKAEKLSTLQKKWNETVKFELFMWNDDNP